MRGTSVKKKVMITKPSSHSNNIDIWGGGQVVGIDSLHFFLVESLSWRSNNENILIFGGNLSFQILGRIWEEIELLGVNCRLVVLMVNCPFGKGPHTQVSSMSIIRIFIAVIDWTILLGRKENNLFIYINSNLYLEEWNQLPKISINRSSIYVICIVVNELGLKFDWHQNQTQLYSWSKL